MAGHSKWATTKHRKAAVDAKRGKLFARLIKNVEVAARTGGADPAGNPTLFDAIQKARKNSVPNENIERAIKRGIGELEGESYEELVYEGYGPGGVAVMLQIMTDNRNRTASEIRHIFSRYGGSLGESGCVAWMFSRKGEIRIAKEGVDEDELMMAAVEAGADDVEVGEDEFIVVTEPESFRSVREALEAGGWKISFSEVTMRANSIVTVEGETAKKLLALLDALEEHDDVQDVFANLDISEESLQAIQS